MDSYSGVNKYLDENIKDNNVKNTLFTVFNNYGYEAMLNCICSSEGNLDFNNEFYFKSNVRDYEQSFTEIDIVNIVNTIPLGRFTSISYWFESTGNLYYNVFYIYNPTSRFEINYEYIKFNHDPLDEYTIWLKEHNVQFNIGWSKNNDLIMDVWIDGEFSRFINISDLCGNEEVLGFATNGSYNMSFGSNQFVKFNIPNKNLVSDIFISNFL